MLAVSLNDLTCSRDGRVQSRYLSCVCLCVCDEETKCGTSHAHDELNSTSKIKQL